MLITFYISERFLKNLPSLKVKSHFGLKCGFQVGWDGQSSMSVWHGWLPIQSYSIKPGTLLNWGGLIGGRGWGLRLIDPLRCQTWPPGACRYAESYPCDTCFSVQPMSWNVRKGVVGPAGPCLIWLINELINWFWLTFSPGPSAQKVQFKHKAWPWETLTGVPTSAFRLVAVDFVP